MKWKIFAVAAILSLLHNEAASNPALLELKAAFNAANTLVGAITGSKSMVDLVQDILGQTTGIEDLQKIILDRLDSMEVNIPEDIQQAAQIDGDLREMFNEMGDINRLYKSYYLRYLNKDISQPSLQDFINKATSIHADGPDRRVTKIFNIICPGELGVIKGSFLDRAVGQLNTRVHHRCSKMKSPQQYIFELYNLIATIELRTFTMVTSAYQLRSFATNADNALDIRRVNEEHQDRMRRYLASVKNALSQAMKDVTRCHPTYQSNYANTIGNVQFVNMVWAQSDYCNHMVITGVRFVIDDLMLHVQIEEGKLLAGGGIEANSQRWAPVGVRFDVNSQKATWNKPSGGSVVLQPEVGFGFAYLRTTYLHHGDVKSQCTDCVLVGVKLALHKISDTRIYYLHLKYAPVDFKTGVISCNIPIFEKSYYPKAEDEYNSRGKPELVEFGAKDGLTVKYFDSNSVYTEPRLPLSGVGIYKASDSSNGDAASLRIFNRDLSASIKTTL